ncbi:MAG: murein hydrolase activator EnvC family protein [Actinomycetota bacterium]
MRRGIIAITALALLAGSAPALHAEPSLDEIEQRIEANEQRIEETREESQDVRDQLEAAEAERQGVASRLDAIRARLADARARLAEVRVELGAARDQLTEWTAELDAAREDLDGSRDLLSERAAAAYRLGPVGHIEVVLGADSLTQLAKRVSYLEAVLSVDSDDVRDVSFARGVVAERQGQVETYESTVADREAEVEERTLEIAQMEAEQAALLEQVDLEIDLKLDTLDDLQDAKEQYEDAVAQLEAQSAQIQGLIQGSGSSGAGKYGGELFWPTAGPIVSGFGYRVHPVYGTTRFHSGVDIDGACSQPIFAGEDGTVLSAGSNGGYGNFTVIDHGDGLATAYAHQSSIGVSSGQSVSRGQQVGLVGTTGLSTGCHLHFEVRINGEPVDPVPYLS